MNLTLNINEKSREGKSILAMLRLLAEKKTLSIIEEVEDAKMIKLIEEGKKSGLADTKRVLQKMGL
ncbi:MAG: hypothetical protein ACKOC0_00910 [Cytophagales bacterium]